MKHKSEQEFYSDVDRSRYRANWSCLIWFFVIGLVLLGAGWWFVKYSGYL